MCLVSRTSESGTEPRRSRDDDRDSDSESDDLRTTGAREAKTRGQKARHTLTKSESTLSSRRADWRPQRTQALARLPNTSSFPHARRLFLLVLAQHSMPLPRSVAYILPSLPCRPYYYQLPSPLLSSFSCRFSPLSIPFLQPLRVSSYRQLTSLDSPHTTQQPYLALLA